MSASKKSRKNKMNSGLISKVGTETQLHPYNASTQASAPKYNVFVGSSIGYLKGVIFHKKNYQNLNSLTLMSRIGDGDGKPNRNKAINCMCWGDSEETSVLGACADGDIFRYNLLTGVSLNFNLEKEDEDGRPKAIRLDVRNSNLFSAYNNGIVKIFDVGVDAFTSKVAPSLKINSCSNGEQEHLECMDHSVSAPNTFVTGGNENSLKVWDVNSPETPVFASKNVKNDWLNLRVPVWFTRVQFYPQSDKIVSGTGFGNVRFYDPSSPQRRPVIEVKCGEHPLTGFCVRPNSDFQVFIGDTTGHVACVDLRKKASVKTYKGCKGGVTDIVSHPTFPIFVVSSVDRFVYCYDPDHSRNFIQSVYLKNSLNCLLCTSSWEKEDYGQSTGQRHFDGVGRNIDLEGKDGAEADSDEDNDIWSTMEVVGSKKRATAGEPKTSKRKAAKKSSK